MAFVIVGIGNPGSQYQFNRHNIGFLILDALVAKYQLHQQKKHQSLIASTDFNVTGQKNHLVWPQQYVNCSGAPVRKILEFHKLPPTQLLVIHDELDLPQGIVKLKFSGGTAGHNGLKDISQAIGKDYWRMRIGIGHPGNPDRVSNYVLSNFGKQEMTDIFIPLIDNISDNFHLLLTDDEITMQTNKQFLSRISDYQIRK